MTIFAQLDRNVAGTSPTNIGVVVTTFTTTKLASAFPDVQARLVSSSIPVVNGMGWNGSAFLTPPFSFAERQAAKQAGLDAHFNQHFDFAAFIREGTASMTSTQVGTFLATTVSNYRSKRASIAAATTDAGLTAIDVTTGWPSNP